ncbi:hypothetical protein GQ464_012470 [Rhodocaloribacter litoris]|uniref:hypothetical protein n=1 Tax=Rhodocaloribacter litoris TaxID=2558931 RepID=UPI0014238461|nr:hypothetical protein [Rhodocaloribacter litoris]QXD14258.1 hypothetical protein GQ464_012470 [Rhodocaloribacter litoris]
MTRLPLHVLYIDPEHQANPLFWQGLGRALAGAGPRMPHTLLVHGSGNRLQSWLEAEGRFADDEPPPPDLVERLLRMETHRIVGLLTDAGVPAVGLQGSDRGLLRRDADGSVTAPGARWVRDLARRRAVPVIAAQAAGGEVPLLLAVEALTRQLADEPLRIVFFTRTNRPGVVEQGRLRDVLPAAELEATGVVADPAPVRTLVETAAEVWLTSPVGFVHREGLQGTRVRHTAR